MLNIPASYTNQITYYIGREQTANCRASKFVKLYLVYSCVFKQTLQTFGKSYCIVRIE